MALFLVDWIHEKTGYRGEYAAAFLAHEIHHWFNMSDTFLQHMEKIIADNSSDDIHFVNLIGSEPIFCKTACALSESISVSAGSLAHGTKI